jgi:cyclopropane fatty-acyl-phospholipid synthase-like methyltransferase
MLPKRLLAALLLCSVAATPAHSAPSTTTVTSPGATVQSATPRKPDVMYLPTPPRVVDAMLKLANVQKDDVVYDLGSGDGRIVIAAAKTYAIRRGVGIDIDPERVAEASANAKKAKVSDRVRFLQQDLFEADFRDATVVTLYLRQDLNIRLLPRLRAQLKPGTRIVSHAFDMGDAWKPEQTQIVDGKTIYLWTIPEEAAR